GTHTSKLMCEALVGVVNPATRQNCGTPVFVWGGVVGVTNVPAGTISAVVMVVFGRWKLVASCVHVKAAAGDAANPIAAAAAADCTYLDARRLFRSLIIIVLPPCLERGHCRIVFRSGTWMPVSR